MGVLLYTSALEIIFAKSIIIDYRGGSTPKNSCVLRGSSARAACRIQILYAARARDLRT